MYILKTNLQYKVHTTNIPMPFLVSLPCSAADGTKSSLCFASRNTWHFHTLANFGPLLASEWLHKQFFIIVNYMKTHQHCTQAFQRSHKCANKY